MNMKNVILKLIISALILSFINNSIACHTTSIDAVTYVNNNNGTTTFSIDFTVGVGSSDGNNYGFALIFSGNSGTPIVQSTPPFSPTYSVGNEMLYAYTGTDIGTGNGTTYFASRYSGRTDILTYEYDGSYWLTSVTYSGTIVVTVQGCVEYIDIDGDFRSLGTAITNPGCVDNYGTNINCCLPTAGTFDTTLCNGASFNFNGTIYNGSNTSGIETITNILGCDSFVTITATELAPITGTFDTTICSSSSFVYNGTTYGSSKTSGTEYLTASSGCDSIISVTLTLQSAININLDTTICYGESFTFNGTTYDTNNLSGTEIITSTNGCDSILSVNVQIEDIPTVTAFNNDPVICRGEQTLLYATGADNYSWEGNTSDTVFKQPNTTTTYFVTGYDLNGCSNTSETTIVVEYCSDIFIPNAFSPNGDGQNDLFTIHGDIKEMELMIFNRWGEKVFESNNQSNYWDGTLNGNILSSGVFVYVAKLDLYQNEIITKKGNITLLR